MKPHTRIARVTSLFAASAVLTVVMALAHPRGWPVAAFAAAAPQQTTRLNFEAEFPAASVGQPYMQSLKAFGGAGGYTFAEGGTLPPGMHWVPMGDGLLLRGTPTQVGEYALRVVVNDSSGQQVTRDVDFKVTPHDTAATVPVDVNETLTTTDGVNVLLPVVVNVNETLTTTDGVNPVAVATTSASLTPASQDFGSAPVGFLSPSSQQTFTLTNTGQTLLTSTAVTVTGTNVSSFQVTGNGCMASLAVDSNCSIYVLFEPAATGPLTATLNVTSTSSTGTVTQTSSLTGTGLPGPTLTVTPNPVSFPATAVNSTAAPITVTLSNTGNGQLGLNGTQLGTLGGADAAYFTVNSGNCGYQGLRAGASCMASATFTPNAARTFNATYTIATNDVNSPAVIPLIGTGGTGTPQATLLPAMASFGTVALGTTSAAQNFTLTNTGTAPLTISNETLGLPTEFVITTNACQSPLAVGASCTLAVAFAPTAAGPASGTLTVTDNAGGTAGTMQSVSFTGTGGQVSATITPSGYNFGNVTVGSSATNVFTVTNTGNSAFSVSPQITAPYSITANTCGMASIPVNGSCMITIAFTPQNPGTTPGTLTLTDAANDKFTATFTGTGVPLTLTLSPGAFDFGNVTLGSGASTAFTLSNPGSVGVSISGVTLTGAGAAAYSQTNNCPATLAGNSSCSINVTLNTSAVGTFAATLAVADNASGSPQTATLTATVAGVAQAVLSPANLSFGAVNVGSTASQTVTLSNPGTATLNGIGGMIGVNLPQFGFSLGTATPCGTSLAAGASCTITVTFTPTGIAPVAGTFSLLDGVGIQTVSLGGSGLQAIPTFTPNSVSFPDTAVGAVSPAQTVQLTNTGNIDLAFNSVSVTGGSSATFTIGSNTCGSSVAAGASCSVSIQFSPSATVGYAANLAFVDAVGTQTVALQGNGIVAAGSPDFSLTYTGDLNVPGAPLTDPVIVDPNFGTFAFTVEVASVSKSLPFTGTVVITAFGVEGGTSFTVTPATVVPGTQPKTITISGGLPAQAYMRHQPRYPRDHKPEVYALAGFLGFCFFLRRRNMRRAFRLLVCLVCLLPLSLTLTGCLYNFYIPSDIGTATVTATSGSTTHSIQVTVRLAS